MSLPRYPEYRDSGVAWLGKVPAHWEVLTLGRVTLDRCDGPFGSGIKSEHYTDEGALVVRLQNIRGGRFHYGEPVFLNQHYFESELRGHEVLPGDVLVAGLGDDNNLLGRACVAPRALGSALVKADCFRFRLDTKRVLPKFAAMQLTAGAQFDAGLLSSGTTRSRIPLSTMETRKVAVPPLPEQTAIAAFLDRETAKIDALIAEQEKLIALLAEKRQATISHAVTKGLNPDAPMKDSGVAWLGEVPAHWEITRLKRLCILITDGAHVSPETEGGEYYFVSTKDLIGDFIDFESSLLTSASSYEQLVKNGCRPLAGDVLFSKDGTIGRTVHVQTYEEFVVASSLIIIRPDARRLRPDFLNYLCKSSVVSQQVEGFVKGAGLPRLSIQNLLKVIGVFPPLVEQDAIFHFLSSETSRLDALTSEATRGIALLKERRSALISAAVTGKIDVRGAVAA